MLFPIVKIPSAGIVVPAGIVIVQSPSVKTKQPILAPGGPINSINSADKGLEALPQPDPSPETRPPLTSVKISLILTTGELQGTGAVLAVMVTAPLLIPLQITLLTADTLTVGDGGAFDMLNVALCPDTQNPSDAVTV